MQATDSDEMSGLDSISNLRDIATVLCRATYDPLNIEYGNRLLALAKHVEVALAQAVELAEYVEEHAKGKMEQAAKTFLSQGFAEEMRKRLGSKDFHDRLYEMKYVLHCDPSKPNSPMIELEIGATIGDSSGETTYLHASNRAMWPLRCPQETEELVLAAQRQDRL